MRIHFTIDSYERLETRTETDPEGRSSRREDWVTTRVRRDTRERVISVSRQEHGNLHNLQSLSYDVRAVSWTDNEDGALSGMGGGSQHRILRNWAGQVIQSDVESSGETESIHYHYGTFGRVTHTYEGGQTWIREYDPRGRLVALTDPDAGIRRFEYNNLGQQVEEQYESGEPYRIAEYDLLGRPTLVQERDEPGDALHDTLFTWDPINNLGALESAYRGQDDVSRDYVYDSLGRISESHLKVAGRTFDFEFEYNDVGELARTLYPNSPAFSSSTDARLTVENVYEDGVLTQVNNADTGAMFWAVDRYSASGSVLDEHFRNGVSTVRHLDPVVGRVSQITSSSTTADLSDVLLDWTEDARLGARTEMLPAGDAAPLMEEFGYDGLGRLTDWHSNGQETGTFQYDHHGNLESLLYKAFDGSGDTVESWGNALSFSGQQVASVNGLEADHDALGRWTSLGGANDMDPGGEGWEVSFNHFDLPTKVDRAGKSTTYRYDAFGARVYSETDGVERISFGGLFDWSGEAGEETFTFRIAGAGGIVAEIIDDTAEIGIGDIKATYVHHDHLGNRTMETDRLGAIIERHRYTPFGERIADDGRRLGVGAPSLQSGFGGHRHEESGFIDMRGRQYDPTIGRFLSVDPLNVQPFNPQSYNGYAYVLNDPLSLTDPSGYGPEEQYGATAVIDREDDSSIGGSIAGAGAVAAVGALMAIWKILLGGPSGGSRGRAQVRNRNPGPKSRIADVQMSRAPRARAPVEGMSLNMVNAPVFGESYSVGSIDVGFVVPTAEAVAWDDFFEYGLAAAEVAGSMVPLVGEAMDIAVILDSSEPTWARVLSGVSLGVNLVTFGVLPNFGGLRRGATRVARRLCFVAGTLVATQAGPVAIEDIEVGDLVLSMDAETGEEAARPVLETFVTRNQEIVELAFVDEDGVLEAIRATTGHPFWTGHTWTPAGELEVGDEVFQRGGSWIEVTSITWTGERETVYNFEVGGTHTYFVGELQAWVHNVGTCDAASSLVIRFTDRLLRKNVMKAGHGEVFGIARGWSAAAGVRLTRAVHNHVNNASIAIEGTFRGARRVTHYLNQQTGVNVIVDPDGNFVAVFQLFGEQLQNVLRSGSL